jgi:hypothetical protein
MPQHLQEREGGDVHRFGVINEVRVILPNISWLHRHPAKCPGFSAELIAYGSGGGVVETTHASRRGQHAV